ncbi:MAG: isochorismatase family cysteine hydrolase [Eubacterium sp.]|nr:isochorismatase family cysteine hydrolase [Eubacterium sp.]
MSDYLIVVDMQKDFVDGALGTKEAVAIVPAVAERIKKAKANGERVIFTRDTHQENYLDTQEGKNLPVRHCIQGTEGWRLIPEVREFVDLAFNKPTFGSPALGRYLAEQGDADRITLIGLCTDICVISNALLIKAFLPEVPVIVEQACCAGVTPESHENALKAMKSCQIIIK